MENNIKMHGDNFSLQDLLALLATGGALLIERIAMHPIGNLTALVGLLYMFDRWRTQRVTYKIKVHELEDIEEHERVTGTNKERKEGTKD